MKKLGVIILLAIIIFSCSKEETEDYDKSAKKITSFQIVSIDYSAPIDNQNKTIQVKVPAKASIHGVTPKIMVSQGASISPASLEEVNLTTPVTYTVTAEDGSNQEYTVSAEILKDTAFLIVDMQNAAFENAQFPIYNAFEITSNIRTVLDKARDANKHIVYAMNTMGNAQEGTYGWQVVPMLTPEDDELLVNKIASNSFEASELQNELSDINIGVVIMCGVATDMCMNNTFLGAKDKAYDIIMIADGHSTSDPGAQEKIDSHNDYWASLGFAVFNSEEINF